jgi:hypothetical protein
MSASRTPLDEIKQLYFKTTKATIERDFLRAVELLKSMPSVDDRQRAHVYMEGLAEMRKEFGPSRPAGRKKIFRIKPK